MQVSCLPDLPSKTFTDHAVSQRLGRMKKEFERAGNGTIKTPMKSGAAPKKSGGSGKRKAQKPSEDGELDDDKDDEEESPLKKVKTKETKAELTKTEKKPAEDDHEEDEWLI